MVSKSNGHRVKFVMIKFALCLSLVTSLNACGPAKFTYTFGQDSDNALSSELGEAQLGSIQRICDQARDQSQRASFAIEFPKPASTCAWNQNGNLGPRDRHFQARTEQVVEIQLPSQAVICDAEFSFQPQNFYYDDEFIFSINKSILASSYDFSNLFGSAAGQPRYDWTRLVGIPWAQVQPAPFCAGADQGLSSCQFPVTSTNGQIMLQYHSSVIQSAFARPLAPGRHQVMWTSLGDNDINIDCLHEPISAQLTVSYIIVQ